MQEVKLYSSKANIKMTPIKISDRMTIVTKRKWIFLMSLAYERRSYVMLFKKKRKHIHTNKERTVPTLLSGKTKAASRAS